MNHVPPTGRPGVSALAAWVAFGVLSTLSAQDVPPSGVLGFDLVYATSSTGSTQLYAVTRVPTVALVPVGSPLSVRPSRWAHRRRTLGALETAPRWIEDGLLVTPMGDAVGNAGLHVVDVRVGLAISFLPTGNPAAYDLAVSESLDQVFVVEDDGLGNSVVRGFSTSVPGTVSPLDPPVVVLPGRPCAGVNTLRLSSDGTALHVPTVSGVHVISLSATSPQMALTTTISTGNHVIVTNAAPFLRNGFETFVAGTCEYDGSGAPIRAGFRSWRRDGSTDTGQFGLLPNLFPQRHYVPAAGTTEIAVVDDGNDAYAYFLLRDPSPTAFFIRPSGVGAVRFLGASPPDVTEIVYPPEGGEPFAIPTVSGTRVAIESSQGPPFVATPPDGGEPLAIIYTPLDSLGASSTHGVLAVPSPLQGRISTKGMDRPFWSHDGTRVLASTSHFPGAPNPGVPGLEVLDVPANIPLTFYNPPHTVVPNLQSPNRTIIFPSTFAPRVPAAGAFLADLTFYGSVFADGMASLVVAPFGEIGQFSPRNPVFVQSPLIPNFPALLPATFADATGPIVPIPGNFGARRTTWNLIPEAGLLGLTMTAAVGQEILIHPSGVNLLIQLGLFPGPILAPSTVTLPAGWVTSSEFVSL